MNSKLVKAGALFLSLGVPVFLYIILKSFGENHYDLKRYFPLEVKTVKDSEGDIAYDTIYHKVADFSLIDQDSNQVSFSSHPAQVYIVDFIFTTCGSICPIMTKQLYRVQDMLKEEKNVHLYSFTVDPEEDTPAVLKAYAQKNNCDPKLWSFVTGDKAQLYSFARNQLFISALEDKTLPIGDQFIHSDKVVLLDKDRVIRGYYNGTDSKEVDRLILEAKILLHEYKKDK